MSEKFILICSNAHDLDDAKLDSFCVAKARMESGVWPLYKNTSHRKRIGSGAICLIYLAGKSPFKGHLVGSAVVSKVEGINASLWQEPLENALAECAESVITFLKIENWEPLNIRTLVPKLEFVGAKGKWGVYFQGGCKKISNKDYELIISNRKIAKTQDDSS